MLELEDDERALLALVERLGREDERDEEVRGLLALDERLGREDERDEEGRLDAEEREGELEP